MSVQNKEHNQQKPKTAKESVRIPEKTLKAIAKAAAESAVTAYQRARDEERGRSKDNRLHNTKLLVENYKKFKLYCDNAIYETAQLCQESNEEILDLMGISVGNSYQVGSIRNGVVVTKIIMEHIDTMLECYKMRCLKSKKPEVQRRWQVLSLMYLAEETLNAQEVADKVHIGKSMVYNDINNACEELSSLIFGLDLSEYI